MNETVKMTDVRRKLWFNITLWFQTYIRKTEMGLSFELWIALQLVFCIWRKMRYQQDLNPIWPQAPRIHNYSHEEIRVKTGLSPMVKPALFNFF